MLSGCPVLFVGTGQGFVSFFFIADSTGFQFDFAVFFFHGFGQQFDQRIDGVDVRGGCVGDASQFNNGSNQGVDFRRSSRFYVLQHGGFVFADFFRSTDSLFQWNTEFDAEFVGDSLGFYHHVSCQLSR